MPATPEPKFRCPHCGSSEFLIGYTHAEFAVDDQGNLSAPKAVLFENDTMGCGRTERYRQGCGHRAARICFMVKPPPPFAIVAIEDGDIVCRVNHEEQFRMKCFVRNARKLGKFLAEKGWRWSYSSSVDFPTEYGAGNADWRSYVVEGAGGTGP